MQKFQISIPEPCHEKWNDMTPNEQGRFCNSCAKTVVDFSAMSDAQLIFYFENLKSQNVCGRVHPEQLDREIRQLEPSKKRIFVYWQYVVAFFMLLSKGQSAKAQGAIKGKMTAQPDTLKKPLDMPVRLGGIRKLPLPATTTAIGDCLPFYFITDENDNPLAGASVQLLPEGRWIVADSSGKINIGKAGLVEQIRVSIVGYTEKTVAVKDVVGNNIQLEKASVMLGEVVLHAAPPVKINEGLSGIMGGLRISGMTIRSSAEEKSTEIAAPGFSIFPNPASPGAEISLSVSVQKEGTYVISITNTLGNTMKVENVMAFGKDLVQRLHIPSHWSAGTYMVKITDSKGRAVASGKLLVK